MERKGAFPRGQIQSWTELALLLFEAYIMWFVCQGKQVLFFFVGYKIYILLKNSSNVQTSKAWWKPVLKRFHFLFHFCVVSFYMHKEINNQDNQGEKSLTGLLCLTPETLATNDSQCPTLVELHMYTNPVQKRTIETTKSNKHFFFKS